MDVRWLESGETVGAQRGDVVVCIADDGGPESLIASLRSVIATTPPDVAVAVVTGEEIAAAEAIADEAGPRPIIGVRCGAGEAARFRAALDASAPADAVIIGSGCVVAAGWLDGLREAAHADARVATATPLGDAPAPVAIAPELGFDAVAASVRGAARGARPRLEAGVGDRCVYVRRSAAELVLSRADGGPREFARACVRAGLCHVLADDVLVSVPGVVDRALPAAGPAVDRVLGVARRAFGPISVTVDARVLTGTMNGTKLHVLELIAALAGRGAARVRAIVPDASASPSADAAALLRSVDGLEIVPETAAGSTPRADVVHRPFQIWAPADLTFLAALGDRLVITHQDLISYETASYFASDEAWDGYRSLTRQALGVADHVVFFSAHVRDDALAAELVEPHRASVVHIGVDHALPHAVPAVSVKPRGADRIPAGSEVMLCLGTDYAHKNRSFAIRLLDELQRHHAFTGVLVLAGSHVDVGSSRQAEQELLASSGRLRAAVLELGPVSEQEKLWLYSAASLVVYPTVHEGFGLVPFEAAQHGVPCLWAPGTAVSEVLPDAAAGIVPWDPVASAERALGLMQDARAAGANVDAIREAAASLTWERAAAGLIELYGRVCDQPPNPAGAIERTLGSMHDGFSEDAVRLVGPGGALPREVERPLLALAMKPRLSGPMFRALRVGYDAAYRLGRRRNGGT